MAEDKGGEFYEAGNCSLLEERCNRKKGLIGACGVCPIKASYIEYIATLTQQTPITEYAK